MRVGEGKKNIGTLPGGNQEKKKGDNLFVCVCD